MLRVFRQHRNRSHRTVPFIGSADQGTHNVERHSCWLAYSVLFSAKVLWLSERYVRHGAFLRFCLQINGFFLEKHHILIKNFFPQGLWKNGDSISEANFGRCFAKKRQHLPFSQKLTMIQCVKPGKCLQNTYLTPT